MIVLGEYPLAEQLARAEWLRAEEVEFVVPDGRSVKALINSSPVRGKDGEVESIIITAQDLAPLEKLERSRTEFLSLVSHELRAPLTSIKGASTTLLTASPELDPAEQREFARIIDEQADHMRGLIGDLLDTGRIDSGTLSIKPEPSGLGALVDRARNAFVSGGRRHAILIDLPPDLPPVMADRRRIVQVLNNLLTNAARHSPESSPIRVEAVRDGGHVAISVSDEGRGVEPERLPRLFSKHAHGDGEDAAVRQGLGLAICKGLVEAHGGRIHAESAGVGRGARASPSPLPVDGEMPFGDAGREDASRGEAHGGARDALASWWSTTTRGRSVSSAMPFRGPATRQSLRATRWIWRTPRTDRATRHSCCST